MLHRKIKLLGWLGGLLLFAAFSGFRGQAEEMPPVVFDTCSEYLVLSTLENEIAVLTSQQEEKEAVGRTEGAVGEESASSAAGEKNSGESDEDRKNMDVTRLPDYVTRYTELYAPETEDSSHEQSTPSGGKVAYLSFDDGPSEQTPVVLDILKDEGIHATFFLIGGEITPEREEIVRRIAEEGHTIGLHTYCHDYDVIYKSVDAFLADYEKVCKRIYEVAEVRPTIYRFPGGSRNHYGRRGMIDAISAEMERRGFCYYDWNVSAEDSVGKPTRYSIRTNIFKDVFRYDEPVILMHDDK
ncbi:MAG: polysaccharide deacetylase, partial [Lachnospiraceae bacterium]|nr:polysaccharide deacetylase [Lachnospiraceae bacterium]